jgi:serine/threonine protein kinase
MNEGYNNKFEDTETNKVSYDLESTPTQHAKKKFDLSEVDTSLTEMSEPLSTDTIALAKTPQLPEKKTKKRLKISCFRCNQKLDLTDMEPFSKVVCPSCEKLIIVPKWFDNYLLEELCGIGGMANVYRGLDLALDREIAIKELHSSLAEDQQLTKLFLHEARTAATLNHYAILPIYTCGKFEGRPYIVMQYMGGGSLEKKLEEIPKKGNLKYREIVQWLFDASEALENARRHGIIHHDIKPGNLMLDADNQIKIADFGLAQAVNDSKSGELLEVTKKMCTPDYVSPEKLLTGEENYKGDIYSLGATFYHLITGQKVFECSSTEEVLKVKVLNDPESIQDIRKDIPVKLANLIMAMLKKAPEKRPDYQTIIKELSDILSRLKKQKQKPAIKKHISTRTIKKPVSTKNKQNKSDKKKDNLMRSMTRILFIVLLVVVLFFLWDSGFFSLEDKTSTPLTTDFLPDVTAKLSEGDSELAELLANRAIKKSVLSNDAYKQAALQKVIAMYLNKNPLAPSEAFQMSNRLVGSGVPKDDYTVLILNFLSSPNVPYNKLQDLLSSDSHYQLLADVAIFVREEYNHGKKSIERNAFRHISSIEGVNNSFWGHRSFRNRISLWSKTINNKNCYIQKIEPLFRKKQIVEEKSPTASSTETENKKIKSPETKKINPLKNLNTEWLKKHRPYAAKRPRPDDFIFSEKKIKKYLNSLPHESIDIETKRLEQLMPLKDHLTQMMLHLPYGKNSIKKKNGKIVKGHIMAGPKFVSVKKSNGKRERIYWKDIHIDQFIDFLKHYALFRKNAQLSGTITRKATAKKRMETAWEYLRIALLCDWYGQYDKAIILTRKAISIDPKIEQDAIDYMLK